MPDLINQRCNCGYPQQLGIPCVHLMAYRISKGLPIVAIELFAKNWNQESEDFKGTDQQVHQQLNEQNRDPKSDPDKQNRDPKSDPDEQNPQPSQEIDKEIHQKLEDRELWFANLQGIMKEICSKASKNRILYDSALSQLTKINRDLQDFQGIKKARIKKEREREQHPLFCLFTITLIDLLKT